MFDRLFRFFESRIQATEPPPPGAPPRGLLAFYGHFVGQNRGIFVAMLFSCLLVALSDTVTPVLIGKLVGLLGAADRQAALAQAVPMLIAMAVFMLVLRPAVVVLDALLRFNTVMPG